MLPFSLIGVALLTRSPFRCYIDGLCDEKYLGMTVVLFRAEFFIVGSSVVVASC